MGNRTFAIIKPDAVRNGSTGKIYDKIIKADFKIIAAKLLKLTKAQAEEFYAIHKQRPFYDELINFMSSGACMILALEKDNAVVSWRETIGATDPKEAAEGTIRKDFGESVEANSVHGSDSLETADSEIAYFFSVIDITG